MPFLTEYDINLLLNVTWALITYCIKGHDLYPASSYSVKQKQGFSTHNVELDTQVLERFRAATAYVPIVTLTIIPRHTTFFHSNVLVFSIDHVMPISHLNSVRGTQNKNCGKILNT